MKLSNNDRAKMIDQLVEDADASFLIDEYCDIEELAQCYEYDLEQYSDEELRKEYILAYSEEALEWLEEVEPSAEPTPPDPRQIHLPWSQPGNK